MYGHLTLVQQDNTTLSSSNGGVDCKCAQTPATIHPGSKRTKPIAISAVSVKRTVSIAKPQGKHVQQSTPFECLLAERDRSLFGKCFFSNQRSFARHSSKDLGFRQSHDQRPLKCNMILDKSSLDPYAVVRKLRKSIVRMKSKPWQLKLGLSKVYNSGWHGSS